MSLTLSQRIAERRNGVERLQRSAVEVSVHEHDEACGLNEGRCEVLYARTSLIRSVLVNGAWTTPDQGGAA